MYIRMTAMRIRVFTILLILLLAAEASARERIVFLGREDNWADMVYQLGLRLRSGYRGELDLSLRDGEYEPEPETDLLLHFNRAPFIDAAGLYRVVGAEQRVSPLARLGQGAARFDARDQGLLLEASREAMFAAGQSWDDFSIEFWLYPAALDDGESILDWEGSRRTEEDRLEQRFRVEVHRRRLRWELTNVFFRPDHEPHRIVLEGDRSLIPRSWSHHLLRFEAGTGLIEYLVDGVPRDLRHVTDTGREGGDIYLPYLGQASKSQLRLGVGYSGLIDQLRFSRRYVTDPMLDRTDEVPAVGITRAFDLGHPLSQPTRIDARFQTPGETDVFFFYRLSDDPHFENLHTGWRRFEPGDALPDRAQGRFLQLRVELYPDGRRRESPSVSWLAIRYEQASPPAAPARLWAEPGDGTVRLRWDEVVDPDVDGYYVYYGTRPGQYFGTGAVQGRSPVDVGDVTEVELEGLENGTVYYFAVAAYDAAGIIPETRFSQEAHARPSRRNE